MPDFESLISSYNFGRKISAGFHLLGGLLAYSLAYLFFRYSLAFACHLFGVELDTAWFVIGSMICLLLITWSAFKTHRHGLSTLEYEQSMDHRMLNALHAHPTVGSVVVDHYASRVTAPAFVLSRLFLAGPGCLLKIPTLLGSMIPWDGALRSGMSQVYTEVKSIEKWHGVESYVNSFDAVLRLSQLNLIDLDLRKGRIKRGSTI